VIDRLNTYLRFSIIYTDSDQLLLWQVTKDLVLGSFHGPCFYGQSYNPILEPLFAVPFVHAGLNCWQALPLVTTLLSLSPLIILSLFLYRKTSPAIGIIPLMIALLLPPEYAMLTSLPRGFVTGIFFGMIGLLTFSSASDIKRVIGGVCFGLGIYASPNCILLLPLIIIYLPHQKKDIYTSIKPFILGLLLSAPVFVLNYIYYQAHPELIVHPSPDLTLSIASFTHVLDSLDNYFTYVTPVIWRASWLSLLLFLLVGFRLWKFGKKREALLLFTFFFAIVGSFFTSKVSEGTDSLFFSGARMFLAYPFLLIFLFIFWLNTFNEKKAKMILHFTIALSLLSFSVKLIAFDFFLKEAIGGAKYTVVNVITIDDLKKKCNDMLLFADNKADLVLAITSDGPEQVVNYGCPCLTENFPATIQSKYERRSWLTRDIQNKIHDRILIHAKDTVFWSRARSAGIKVIRKDTAQGWMLIENDLRTKDLIGQISL
jgi:hypothetical protein